MFVLVTFVLYFGNWDEVRRYKILCRKRTWDSGPSAGKVKMRNHISVSLILVVEKRPLLSGHDRKGSDVNSNASPRRVVGCLLSLCNLLGLGDTACWSCGWLATRRLESQHWYMISSSLESEDLRESATEKVRIIQKTFVPRRRIH